MNKTKLKKIIILIIWMIIIFMFSNQPNSGEETHSIIEKILPILNKNTIDVINLIIRKLAHITEYFILAYLSYSLLKEYKLPRKKEIIICILFCVLYSITDELHQSLVPGRTSAYKDCLIDTIGIILFILTNTIIKNKHLKNKQ